MPVPEERDRVPGVLADAPPVADGPAPPPAPWRCRVDALLWWHRATPDARRALPGALAGSRLLPVTVGMWLRYHDSPVGGYDELVGSPGLLPGAGGARRPCGLLGHVPFVAVDSAASVRAGRANWALPKVTAAFGPAGPADAGGELWATGAGWRVAGWRTGVSRPRPAVPARLAWGIVQQHPDGSRSRTSLRLAGTARPARLRLAVRAPTALAGWLRGGHHRALLVTDARLTVGRPTPLG